MLWKCCTWYVSKCEHSAVATGLEKANFHSNTKGNTKECSSYCTIAPISHSSRVMLKILQVRLQQYVNHEFPEVQAGFRKGRGTRDQITNIRWITEKPREFQKNICCCFIDYAKSFDCGSQQTAENSSKRWESQTTLPASWEICMQIKTQQLELDIEQWTGSKLGKEYVKAVYCQPAYLTYLQSTSWEILGWMKQSWNQDFQEKYQ